MILCLGTTPAVQRVMTFDRLTVDAVNRAVDVVDGSAGKAVNVAKVVRALGHDVLALGVLGGDSGRVVRADLDRRGVAHRFVEVPVKTRTCVTLVDRTSGTTTELVEEASPIDADAYAQLLGALDEALAGALVLVLSGTLPPGAPDDFYAACIQRAASAGVATIVDAKGEPLHEALAARPTVVKPNAAELAQTLETSFASDADVRAGARQLAQMSGAWTVVTRGAHATVLSDGTQSWLCHGPRVTAVNPIGSGDSVAAGLAVGIARGQSIPEAVRLGIACGAANAVTQLAGDVRLADVETLYPQTRLERV